MTYTYEQKRTGKKALNCKNALVRMVKIFSSERIPTTFYYGEKAIQEQFIKKALLITASALIAGSSIYGSHPEIKIAVAPVSISKIAPIINIKPLGPSQTFALINEETSGQEASKILLDGGLHFEALAVLIEKKPSSSAFFDPAVDHMLGKLVDIGYGYCVTRTVFEHGVLEYKKTQPKITDAALHHQIKNNPLLLKKINEMGEPFVQNDLEQSGFSTRQTHKILLASQTKQHLENITVSHQQSIRLLHKTGSRYKKHSARLLGSAWNGLKPNEKAAITYLDYQANISRFPQAIKALSHGNILGTMNNVLPQYKQHGVSHKNFRTLGFLQASLYSYEAFQHLIQHPHATEILLESHETLGTIFGNNPVRPHLEKVIGQQVTPIQKISHTHYKKHPIEIAAIPNKNYNNQI